MLLVQDPKLVAELMGKENEVSIKELPFQMPLGLGFFLESGEKALHLRSIFAKCFYSDKMYSLTPKIVEIIESNFRCISEKFG